MTEMSMQAGPETPPETETAPGTGDVVISCTGLGKCYETYASPQKRLLDLFRPGSPRRSKSFWGLRGLDLSVCRGETLGIIGRNGAGKSTLLQLLCGTLTSSEGQLVVKGRIAALLELGAGFNPEFTGIENVYLNAAILGLSRAQIDARLDSILAFAEIGDFVHEPVKHYSSGMFLRLAFAVVAHVDADVLIIDEALAVGDAVFAQKCMRFLHEFRQRGVLLLVSHDLPSITALCDRALWLENGQVRMLGQAKNVVEAYLEAIYADQQSVGGHTAANDETAARHKRVSGQVAEAPHDLRRDLLLHSNLRNDVEIRPFDPDSRGFGTGKVRIEWVGFRDDANRPLAWLVGGEELTLEVRFQVREQVSDLIVGFLFKDRLGQALFGDNTYLTYRDQPPMFRSGECGVARFKFSMPYLPSGDYAITIGVAGGTQQQHVQHCWMHEALVISCVASHVTHGLLGMPMKDIRVEELKDGETEVRLND